MAPKIYRPLFVFVSSDQRIYALRSPLQIYRRLGLMKNVNRSTPAPSIDQIIRVVVKKRSFPGQADICLNGQGRVADPIFCNTPPGHLCYFALSSNLRTHFNLKVHPYPH